MVIESELKQVPPHVTANVTRLCCATLKEARFGQVVPEGTQKTGWVYAISDYPGFSEEISALRSILTNPNNRRPATINLLRDRCDLLEIKDAAARGLLASIIISRCAVGEANQVNFLKAQKDLVLEEITLAEGQDPTLVTVEEVVRSVLSGSLRLSRSLGLEIDSR